MRNERVREWLLRAAGCSAGEPPLGVDDRGVAREGEDEEFDDELRSRPVTGGFLAAMVDMVDLVVLVRDGMRTRQTGCERERRKNRGKAGDAYRAERVYNKQSPVGYYGVGNVGKPRCGEWDAVVLDLNRALPASKWISLLLSSQGSTGHLPKRKN